MKTGKEDCKFHYENKDEMIDENEIPDTEGLESSLAFEKNTDEVFIVQEECSHSYTIDNGQNIISDDEKGENRNINDIMPLVDKEDNVPYIRCPEIFSHFEKNVDDAFVEQEEGAHSNKNVKGLKIVSEEDKCGSQDIHDIIPLVDKDDNVPDVEEEELADGTCGEEVRGQRGEDVIEEENEEEVLFAVMGFTAFSSTKKRKKRRATISPEEEEKRKRKLIKYQRMKKRLIDWLERKKMRRKLQETQEMSSMRSIMGFSEFRNKSRKRKGERRLVNLRRIVQNRFVRKRLAMMLKEKGLY